MLVFVCEDDHNQTLQSPYIHIYRLENHINEQNETNNFIYKH